MVIINNIDGVVGENLTIERLQIGFDVKYYKNGGIVNSFF